MFRSLMTIIRELYLYLTKDILMLKHWVSLCTAHNTHAALQSHSALHITHMPLLTLHYTQHTCRYSLCTTHNTHAATHSALHTTHMPLYDMLPHHLIYITT